MDTISTSLKVSMIVLGSIIGSAAAFAFVPATNIRDGAVKWLACCMVTGCVTSAIVNAIVRVLSVQPTSVPDMLLALSCVFGLCSQWIINALIDIARQDGKTAIRDVIRAFLPWMKSQQPPSNPN